ncbi:MAG TPA: dihydroxyacetone kinase subunit DhaL [Alphaproteobacteria bacterium]|nr:dihydroxyacetone kinase subunit DhaL [Alphaproteobacteria bacterium]
MSTDRIIDCISAVQRAILANERDIEALDREIGDGDHFINVRRGCAVAADMRDQLQPLSADEALNQVGLKLLSTIGGASGPLIASFFMAMGKALKGVEALDSRAFATAFSAGVDAIRSRGKADLGEKTMLDVLIPVSRLFDRMAAAGEPLERICGALKDEAHRGMISTRDMVATKGRAHFLGDRAIGHIDPGSKTCQVAIWAICDLFLERERQLQATA